MDTERAWSAGIFEARGTVTVCDGRPRLQVRTLDWEVADRFRQAVGGKVYGPYEYQSAPEFYLWVADGDRAVPVFKQIAPYLSARLLHLFAEAYPGVTTPAAPSP